MSGSGCRTEKNQMCQSYFYTLYVVAFFAYFWPLLSHFSALKIVQVALHVKKHDFQKEKKTQQHPLRLLPVIFRKGKYPQNGGNTALFLSMYFGGTNVMGQGFRSYWFCDYYCSENVLFAEVLLMSDKQIGCKHEYLQLLPGYNCQCRLNIILYTILYKK